MTPIPTAPLLLGLAGLLPFLWGFATALVPDLAAWGQRLVGGRFVAPHVQLAYGQVILSFMSGVLWGFATRTDGRQAAIGYGLSVLPALWAFFAVGGGAGVAAANLMAGFAALLLIDRHFARLGLAPPWWMTLRLLLTAVVLVCLAPVAIRG